MEGKFFSKNNISKIQEKIRYKIKIETSTIIPKQNERTLKVIMLSVKESYPQLTLKNLNKKVIQIAVRDIINSLKDFFDYYELVNKEKDKYLANPINTKKKGTKEIII